MQEVDIGEFKNYYNDFKRADKLTGGRKDPKHNTWHHHEDQKTLQEINRDIHEMFKHKGGMSLNKKKLTGR